MKLINKLIKIIKLRCTKRDIIDLIFLPIILIINVFVCYFIKKKNIWLIQEDSNEACDNGYILYKYIKENECNINCYYVINYKVKDYLKVRDYGTTIKYKSLKHWLYYLNSKVIISSQNHANPLPIFFHVLHQKNIIKIPRVFLQHGITKDFMPNFHYSKINYRLFICGAKNEYNYLCKTLGYPKGYIVYTGFARFDNLNTSNKINNKILIMPTWRRWMNNKQINNYFNIYNSLLNNKWFINYIEKNNIIINFVLHKNMKKDINKLHSCSKNIIINNNQNIDIQKMLNECDLLITDYSSIAFDVAYMYKPVIYYQFDLDKYRLEHYKEGYFSYKKNGFGDVLYTEDALIDKIVYYINNSYNIESKYQKRIDNFFTLKDKNNCKRIVNEIQKIL